MHMWRTALAVLSLFAWQDLHAEASEDKRLDDFAANKSETGQPEVYVRINNAPLNTASKAVRNRDRLPLSYQSEAAAALREIQDYLISGNPKPAFNRGEYYWHKFQYARVGPEILHGAFRGAAALRPRANRHENAGQPLVFLPRVPLHTRSHARGHVDDRRPLDGRRSN